MRFEGELNISKFLALALAFIALQISSAHAQIRLDATDPYEVLGVSKTDAFDAIKKTYRRVVHSHHPDSAEGNTLEEKAQPFVFYEPSTGYFFESSNHSNGATEFIQVLDEVLLTQYRAILADAENGISHTYDRLGRPQKYTVVAIWYESDRALDVEPLDDTGLYMTWDTRAVYRADDEAGGFLEIKDQRRLQVAEEWIQAHPRHCESRLLKSGD